MIVPQKNPPKSHKNFYCKILALGIFALKSSVFQCYAMNETSENNSDKSIWSSLPSASEAYGEYLEYAGEEVTSGILHNQKVCNSLSSLSGTPQQKVSLISVDVVEETSGKFYPLSSYLKSNGYCSKLTIRNLDPGIDLVSFVFTDNAYYRTVTIKANAGEAKNINMARRTIVPTTFKQCPQLAGPQGFHEYLIDGSNYKSKGEYLDLTFFINPETPIKINLQNCKGSWFVNDLADQTNPTDQTNRMESIKSKFKWDENTKISFMK